MIRIVHWTAALIFTAYMPLAAIPGEWLWYDPGVPQFGDTEPGQTIPLFFTRNIKRSSLIEYSTVLRNADTGEVVCDGGGGPFRYLAQSGPVLGYDLKKWMGSPKEETTCPDHLPTGRYWMETTWVIQQPLGDLLSPPFRQLIGWIIPPKTIERSSPAFSVRSL